MGAVRRLWVFLHVVQAGREGTPHVEEERAVENDSQVRYLYCVRRKGEIRVMDVDGLLALKLRRHA